MISKSLLMLIKAVEKYKCSRKRKIVQKGETKRAEHVDQKITVRRQLAAKRALPLRWLSSSSGNAASGQPAYMPLTWQVSEDQGRGSGRFQTDRHTGRCKRVSSACTYPVRWDSGPRPNRNNAVQVVKDNRTVRHERCGTVKRQEQEAMAGTVRENLLKKPLLTK